MLRLLAATTLSFARTAAWGLLQPACPSCADPLDLPAEPLCARCLALLRADLATPRLRCERCHATLQDPARPVCPACARDRSALGRVRGAVAFHAPARALVHGLKFDRQLPLAEPMARWMVAAWHRDWEPHETPDALVPVPLHWTRRHARGFNQASLLAREVGAMLGREIDEAILVRAKATRQQALLGPAERADNVADAFHVAAPSRAAGRSFLLVDDVATSGATLRACANALRRAGADRVDALLFARA